MHDVQANEEALSSGTSSVYERVPCASGYDEAICQTRIEECDETKQDVVRGQCTSSLKVVTCTLEGALKKRIGKSVGNQNDSRGEH